MEEKYDNKTITLAEIAKAMSHPARVHILEYLSKMKECSFTEIYFELPIAKATVSQHLKELKLHGLITSYSDGLKVIYQINQKKLDEVKELFGSFFDSVEKKG